MSSYNNEVLSLLTFYKSYVKLCAEKGVAPSAVAEKIGLSRTSPHGWKNGKMPSDVNLQKIADYFGVSVEYLKGEIENPSAISGKGEKKFTVGAFEEKGEQGIETINVNMNTLADVTELVDTIKDLSSEKIRLLISIAKSMK